MATNFPASLDTLTNPTSSDSLSSPSHSAQHANSNDAIEALQAKVGADSSAVTSSLDYKVAQLEAAGSWVNYAGSQTFGAGLTVGNGTLASAYARVNDVVFMRGYFVLGSTSAVTGNIDISVPFTPVAAIIQEWPGHARFWDQSANVFYGGTPVSISSTLYRLTYMRTVTVGSFELVRNGDCSASAPFSWATGDGFFWSFFYQAA